MKKVIVTGSTGFIGQWLVRKLVENNVDVIAIVRNERSNIDCLPAKVKVIYCELESISNLCKLITDRDIDVFYHLAWSGIGGESRADYQMQLNNAKYTCDSAVVAKEIGCKKFIGTGTITEKIAEDILDSEINAENTIYGIAKHTTHCMLQIICKQMELNYVWAQMSNIYDAENTTGNIISYTLAELKKGNSPTFSRADQPYDLMYIKDAATALFLLGEKANNKNRYFIGSGEPRILREYLLEIGDVFGDRDRIKIGMREDDGLRYNLEWFDTRDLVEDTGFKTMHSFSRNIKDVMYSTFKNRALKI